jgi:glycosyltransferase involved in cell wall biosynthesis
MRELLGSSKHQYVLVADDRQLSSTIKDWRPEDATFVLARCTKLPGLKVWFQSGLVKLALRKDLDAIIYWSNPFYLCTWISALCARLAGKRVLFWTHGWNRRESGVKAWVRQIFNKLPHAFLLYGHFAKSLGMERGFSPDNLHVIYNSLDYEAQKRVRETVSEQEILQTRQELFAEPTLPLVICSARLIEDCRLDLLIQAQSELERQGHRFNVILVGDGPERKRLEALSIQYGVPVNFYGACYDEKILGRLTMAADVTVSPGKVGLTAMQSLAYGTPVITHNNFERQGPEWEAIIAGETGDFFQHDDLQDLTEVIK